MLIKGFIVAFLLTFVWKSSVCDKARIAVVDERFRNGDEGEFVSVELKRRDNSEDIKLIAQIRFHLKDDNVFVNNHRILHGIVNSIRMRVQIIEIERGIRKTPRLAPVTFRVLVLEQTAANGNKLLTLEEEFIAVEEFEVLQVEVKQLIWESSIRKPVVPIKLEESNIHRKPHKHDHHVFVEDPDFKPRLPKHGLRGEGHPHHHRGHHCKHTHFHHRVSCWFHRLTFGGKIGVIFGGIMLIVGIIAIGVKCCCCCSKNRKELSVQVQSDEFTNNNNDNEVKEMKNPIDNDFHMVLEINEGYVVESDKKELID